MEAYQAGSLALLVISMGMVGMRFWKLRRIKRNTAGIVSDALYVLGLLVFLTMGALFVFLLFKEIRIRKERDVASGSNPMDGNMYLAVSLLRMSMLECYTDGYSTCVDSILFRVWIPPGSMAAQVCLHRFILGHFQATPQPTHLDRLPRLPGSRLHLCGRDHHPLH
jgi:hypothetical protein